MIYAANNDELPVVEYLVESGADMEARDNVSDQAIHMKLHMYHTLMYL